MKVQAQSRSTCQVCVQYLMHMFLKSGTGCNTFMHFGIKNGTGYFPFDKEVYQISAENTATKIFQKVRLSCTPETMRRC